MKEVWIFWWKILSHTAKSQLSVRQMIKKSFDFSWNATELGIFFRSYWSKVAPTSTLKKETLLMWMPSTFTLRHAKLWKKPCKREKISKTLLNQDLWLTFFCKNKRICSVSRNFPFIFNCKKFINKVNIINNYIDCYVQLAKFHSRKNTFWDNFFFKFPPVLSLLKRNQTAVKINRQKFQFLNLNHWDSFNFSLRHFRFYLTV